MKLDIDYIHLNFEILQDSVEKIKDPLIIRQSISNKIWMIYSLLVIK